MKKFFTIFICLILSIGIVFLSDFLSSDHEIKGDFLNEQSKLSQKIVSYSKEPTKQYKLYHGKELIGVLSDEEPLTQAIDQLYEERYEDLFPDTELDLGQDVYVVEEYAHYQLENIDDQIIDYVISEGLYGIVTNVVEFSTKDGVYDVIYIQNLDDFKTARNDFLLNFVSAEALEAFNKSERLDELTTFGSIETGIRISETISTKEGVANPDDIFTSKEEIYTYLCYGRNEERQYYTVQEGETLQGVGFHFDNMSPVQIMMLNPGVIYSVDQVLKAGMVLNVTYYTSPLTVIVTKERLAEEIVIPEAPTYVENDDVYEGQTAIITEERNGKKNVLYEEVWINGVLQSGTIRSSKVTEEPIRGVISIGTKAKPNVGTGNFSWPCENTLLTCGWGCYPGHQATDVVNRYERYADILAADNGTVVNVTYDSIGGNYIIIDHNNGYKTYYGHLNVPAYPEIGDTVMRGEVIGQMGDTGLAFGVHVHFAIYENNVLIDPCTIMRCDAIR